MIYKHVYIVNVCRSHLQPYLDEVLTQVDGLLVLNTPDNGVLHSLSNNDQLFLYETAGVLIVQSAVPPEVCPLLSQMFVLFIWHFKNAHWQFKDAVLELS